jgi:hypothetical protein
LKVSTALVLVLVGLVAVFLVIRLGGGGGGGERSLYEDFAPEAVTRIRIEGADTTAVLVKADQVWFVASEDSFPAEAQAVEAMLTSVKDFSRKDIISSNPAKQSLYQVDSTGVFVTLKDAGSRTLVEFVVGKPGPDYQSTYVRDVASDDVILAPGYLRPTFDRGARTWQDRTIYSFEPGAITEIEIRRPGERMVLVRDDAGEWFVTRPESSACDPNRISRLTRTLAYLRCEEFAGRAPVPGSGLAEADSSIGFRTVDGRREELLFGSRKEDRHTFAKRADSEIVYLLATHKVDAMLPRLSGLRAAQTEIEAGAEGEKGR